MKALRAGHVQLAQAYADIRGGEMWLIGASISEYAQGNVANHATDRDRKLLLKRSEIDALLREGAREGADARPDRSSTSRTAGSKLEVALGRGKDKGDKRRTIADRDAKRQIERALKARR